MIFATDGGLLDLDLRRLPQLLRRSFEALEGDPVRRDGQVTSQVGLLLYNGNKGKDSSGYLGPCFGEQLWTHVQMQL